MTQGKKPDAIATTSPKEKGGCTTCAAAYERACRISPELPSEHSGLLLLLFAASTCDQHVEFLRPHSRGRKHRRPARLRSAHWHPRPTSLPPPVGQLPRGRVKVSLEGKNVAVLGGTVRTDWRELSCKTRVGRAGSQCSEHLYDPVALQSRLRNRRTAGEINLPADHGSPTGQLSG